MEPIVARRSIKTHAWSVLWGVSFFVAAYLLGIPLSTNILISLLIVIGPELLKMARAAADQDEVLRIDESGILDYRLGFQPILWDQIEWAEKSGSRLRLKIREPDALNLPRTLWHRMNQPLFKESGYYVHINVGGLDVKAQDIMRAVLERAPAPVTAHL